MRQPDHLALFRLLPGGPPGVSAAHNLRRDFRLGGQGT
jgi:hypothetical protein